MATTDLLSPSEGSVEVGEPGKIILPIGAKPAANNDPKVGSRRLDWIKAELTEADKHVKGFREDAMQCYRFFANKQLADKDQAFLRAEGRPDTAFNSLQKFIRFVSGNERTSPQILIFAPDDYADEQSAADAEQATMGNDWAEYTSKGAVHRSRIFMDTLITGIGVGDKWVDSTTKIRDFVAGERVSPLEYIWPEDSSENHSKTRWRCHEIFMDPEQIKRKWPDFADKVDAFAKSGFDPDRPEPGVVQYILPYVTTINYDKKGPQQRPGKKLMVQEFQWWDEEEGYVFQDAFNPDPQAAQQLIWMQKPQFATYQSRLQRVFKKRIEGYEEKEQKVFRRVFLLERNQQLGDVQVIPAGRFTLNVMTAYWDEEEKRNYGLERIFIDPQRYANKFWNLSLEILSTNAKNGLIVEEGAIDPKSRRDFEKNFAKPGTVSVVAQGAISGNMILPKPKGDIPQGMMAMMEWCINAMDQISGLNPGSMGLDQGGNVPQGTIAKRQSSGLMLVAREFDALSQYRIEEGYINLGLLKVIADGRSVFAGQNPYDPKTFLLEKRVFEREYRAYLDDISNDPTVQAKYAENIMQLAPTLIRMGWFLPDMLDYIKYIPLKQKQALKQQIMQKAQADAQAAAQGQPTGGGRGAAKDPRETEAKIQKTQADAALSMARADALTKGRKPRDLATIIKALVDAHQLEIEKERLGLDKEDQRLKRDDHNLARSQHQLEQTRGVVDSAATLVDLFRGEDQGGSSDQL